MSTSSRQRLLLYMDRLSLSVAALDESLLSIVEVVAQQQALLENLDKRQQLMFQMLMDWRLEELDRQEKQITAPEQTERK